MYVQLVHTFVMSSSSSMHYATFSSVFFLIEVSEFANSNTVYLIYIYLLSGNYNGIIRSNFGKIKWTTS